MAVTTFLLRRSGFAPIQFDGELIAKSELGPGQERPKDMKQNFNLFVYRVPRSPETYQLEDGQHFYPDDRFMAAIQYRTSCTSQETDADYAELCDSIEDVARYFADHDIYQDFIGPPKGHAKYETITKRIELEYDRQVSEVMENMPLVLDQTG